MTAIHQYVAAQEDAELDNAELEDVALTFRDIEIDERRRQDDGLRQRRRPAEVSDPTADILLIGGGIASANAAAELREQGFEGSILLVTREMDAPYHRPPLTKGYLQGREDRPSTLIQPEAWYAEHDVERAHAHAGHGPRHRGEDGEARPRAASASGRRSSRPARGIRRLQVDGGMRDGIHYIRALGNADKLRNELDDAERVVVVGGSYIATEVAASMVLLGKQVTLVMQEALPLERGFGPVAGRFAHDLLTSHGIEILAEADVAQFDGEGEDDAPVTRRRLRRRAPRRGRPRRRRRRRQPGRHARPQGQARARRERRRGLRRTLRTSAEGVWAAGDMCEYDSVVHGRRVRIEHEEVAAAQGRHAARAMLGSDEPYREIPYFWSDLADWATLEYVGAARELGRGDRPRRPGERGVQRLLRAGRPRRRRARRRPRRGPRRRARADRRRRRRRRAAGAAERAQRFGQRPGIQPYSRGRAATPVRIDQ